MAILLLCQFGCEMPIFAHFGEFFGGFDPLNAVGYFRDLQKAHPWPETRVLAYRSCRSVKKCDLGEIKTNKNCALNKTSVLITSVVDYIQTAVFTSAKCAQYIKILRRGCKQMSKNQNVASIFKMADGGVSRNKENSPCSTDQLSGLTTHLTSFACVLESLLAMTELTLNVAD